MHRGGERQSATVGNVTGARVRMAAILDRLSRDCVTRRVFPEVLEEELNRSAR